MGWMDRLRAELVDIVEWVDDSRHTLVWRFPRYQNEIKNGAQLLVRPGQTAILVGQGQIADVFGPGRHRLETANLPILSSLLGWKYGFDSPFKAEVYFVNTTQMTDLKWGTPNPIMLRDPDFGPLRVRAFGTYTLKTLDPCVLLRELVGTDGVFDTEEISELLRSIINSAFAEVVASAGLPVLDLASHYDDLSHRLREAVAEQIDDEYGLCVPQLFIVNISLPAEVEQALDARSSMGVVGDLGRYQAYQLGRSMPLAASNPEGGAAGAALGAGMGIAMAAPMLQAAPVAEAPPPLPAAASWHVASQGVSAGPFATAQVAGFVADGSLQPDTLVWRAGMADWAPAGRVEALAALFQRVPPPLPAKQR